MLAKAYFANIAEPISVRSCAKYRQFTLCQISVLVLEVLSTTSMNFGISMELERLLKLIVF